VLVVVAIVAVVVAVGLYATWLGSRLDRLDTRVEAASASLDAQLRKRAGAAARAAARSPAAASRVGLAEAAHTLLQSGEPRQEAAESALTRALRGFVEAAPAIDLTEITTAVTRVQLARQFHNDAVHATRTLRGRRMVRLLRLAAHRPVPAYFEIDDTLG
jgi:hypothetical protein